MTLLDYVPFAYGAICSGVVLFQVALVLGAPWGPITQGGSHPGRLPVSGRIVAAASIVVLVGMALAIASAAGLWPHWPRWTSWAALAVQFVSTVLNWITPSRPERLLWAPITSVMLALAASAVVAS
jgi:hypothetical protein